MKFFFPASFLLKCPWLPPFRNYELKTTCLQPLALSQSTTATSGQRVYFIAFSSLPRRNSFYKSCNIVHRFCGSTSTSNSSSNNCIYCEQLWPARLNQSTVGTTARISLVSLDSENVYYENAIRKGKALLMKSISSLMCGLTSGFLYPGMNDVVLW